MDKFQSKLLDKLYESALKFYGDSDDENRRINLAYMDGVVDCCRIVDIDINTIYAIKLDALDTLEKAMLDVQNGSQ